MNRINAKIIADSINNYGNRITSFVLTYPRIIHAEMLTHRAFSRNAASSRAVPSQKLIQSVLDEPFIPIAFQSAHSGMQGMEYLNEEDTEKAIEVWLEGRDEAVERCRKLINLGVTKQIANRGLETYQYYTSIVTATDWENFFELRCPRYDIGDGLLYRSKKDAIITMKLRGIDTETGEMFTSTVEWLMHNKGQAEIHLMALAEAIWDAMNESIPNKLDYGEWHIPFGDSINEDLLREHISKTHDITKLSPKEYDDIETLLKVKIATARCARVSYTVVGEEGKPNNYDNDIKLHDRLAASGHMSPFEHCAKVPEYIIIFDTYYGNLCSFMQYRKTFGNENFTRTNKYNSSGASTPDSN